MIFIWKLPFFFGSLTRGKREAGVCLSVWFISLIADNILDFHVIFCFVFFPPDLVLTPTKWNAVDAITVEKIVGIFPKWRRRHRLATHSPKKKKKRNDSRSRIDADTHEANRWRKMMAAAAVGRATYGRQTRQDYWDDASEIDLFKSPLILFIFR